MKILLLSILLSFFLFSYCSAQENKISYNGENTFFISSALYSELKINGAVSFADIRQEERWKLLIKEFGEPEETRRGISLDVGGGSRIDKFDGLTVFYSEYEDPTKLLANRIKIDNPSFSLTANNFELSIGKPINDLLPSELNNKLAGENYVVLYIEYEKDSYADIESIGLEIDPYSGIIKSMLIILWRP